MRTHRRGRQKGSLRIYCEDCQKKITVNGKNGKANDLLREHLNRKSYRQLSCDYGISKNTICSFTNSVTRKLIHSNELTGLLKPRNYSGILLADGKYPPVKKVEEETDTLKIQGKIPKSRRRGKTRNGLVLIPFIDYETHDIPAFVIAASENMFEIREGFRKLKDLGYPLKVLVCDESMGEIAQVAREFYPDVVIQTCLTHYTKCIEREFQINHVKRGMKKLERCLKKLGDSIFMPTHHHDIRRAIQRSNEMADLEFEFDVPIGLQSLFQEMFWRIENGEELAREEDRMNELLIYVDFKILPHAKKIRKRYLDYYEKWDEITIAARKPELMIPRTTNLIEGFNSTTVELRLSSIRGFEKEETARNYINAMILKYRFHKFTDCREPFKHLNGRSPIEISDPLHNLKNLRTKDWVELCRKLKP